MDSAGRSAVLILVENLPVPLDRRVWQESLALRDAGYDVSVVCPRMRGYVKPEEEKDGVMIYRHWISDEAGGFFGFFLEYASALLGEFQLSWKAWRRRPFRVIHLCNPPDLLFLVAAPFKFLFGVKVIFDVHDVWPEMFEAKFGRRGPLYWLVRLAERATLALADHVIATNESVKQIVVSRGGKSTQDVTVVRTAPQLMDFQALSDEALKKGRRYLVCYIGVMGNADGVRYLMEAAEFIVRNLNRQDIQFLFMGAGPEWEFLVQHCQAAGLTDYVDLPGRVSDEFLCRALQTMDVGVSCDPINAYNHHCTMNKVLEYMAFGKAQVMFDLQEGRYSAGDAAAYVAENTAESLAKAMVALLDDEPRRLAMGRLGKERFWRDLSWDRSVAALRGVYDSVTK